MKKKTRFNFPVK